MYNSLDIAIIIPTKDRPHKIRNLLNSIHNQTVPCRRIIIVDSGDSILSVVNLFSTILPIEYYQTDLPGQIRQRNMAISKLDDRTKLVATFDDDIVLYPDSFEKMLNFWNFHCPSKTAGVSFNVVNCDPDKHSFIKGLIGLTGPLPGKVLQSGRNTSIVNLRSNIQTEWLCGGATVWRQKILQFYPHEIKDAKWSIYEDLIFSYPIGKKYPLFVCADAKVNHEHVYDQNIKQKYYYLGSVETLWRFAFVRSNLELSFVWFYWNQLATIFGRILLFLIKGEKKHFQFCLGQINGCFKSLYLIYSKKSIN